MSCASCRRLIVTEAEIERRDRAARARLRGASPRQQAGGRLMSKRRGTSSIITSSAASCARMLAAGAAMKAKQQGASAGPRPLDGKTLAMIFEKPSTRTRVSFDVGMRQLGGEAIMLTGADMQLGRGETIADTARVLSRYVDAIMIRIFDHDRCWSSPRTPPCR